MAANNIFLQALGVVAVLPVAFLTGIISATKRNVVIVDSVWSLMFILGAMVRKQTFSEW